MYFFIHLSVDRHVCCFYVLDIINIAITIIIRVTCLLELWFSQGICPVVGLLDHMVVLLLVSFQFSSVQSLSHVRLLATPWTAARPGLPVHHQFPESTQTHVHRVGDDIQPSHPLSSPSPPALNLSQHQGLFQWVSSSHQVAKVLEFQLQHESFQWTPRTDIL